MTLRVALTVLLAGLSVACTTKTFVYAAEHRRAWSEDMIDCGDQDPTECAIDHYSQLAGIAPRLDCQDIARATTFEFMAPAEVERRCGSDGVAGCLIGYSAEGGHALLAEDAYGRDPVAAAHETMHALLRCQNSDADNHHRSGVWRGLNPAD